MNEVKDLLIGLEIGRETSQIACYDRKMMDAECISTKAGTDLYAFPTVLGKVRGADEWHFGREAEYFAARGEIVTIPDLYGVFSMEVDVPVDRGRMEPWQILAVYIRETLGLLGVNDVLHSVKGLMITTDHLERLFARNCEKAVQYLFEGRVTASVQDKYESFYHYCMNRNPDAARKKCA